MMRQFIVLLLSVFVFTGSLLAQTEIWKISGSYNPAVNGMQNDFYVGGGSGPISRIDTNGNILWEVNGLIDQRNFVAAKKGLFVLYDEINSWNAYPDSVSYIDSAGNLLWTNPVKGRFTNRSSLSNDGNLLTIIVAENRDSQKDTLYSISPSGEVLLRVALPSLFNSIQAGSYIGPRMDGTGKIWVFNSILTSTDVTVKGIRTQKSFNTVYLYIFDGTTGEMLNQKVLFNNKIYAYTKSDSRGTIVSYEQTFFGNPFSTFSFANDYAIVPVNMYDLKLTRNRNGGDDLESNEAWLWYTISPSLKMKTFSYQGTGAQISRSSVEKQIWKQGSWIYDVTTDANGFAYLTGTVTKGKAINDVGSMKIGIMALKFNVAKNKIVWKKNIENTFTADWNPNGVTTQITSDNKLIIFEDNSFNVLILDSRNGKTTSTLTLPARISVRSDMRSYISEDFKSLYICGGSLTKYSLSGLNTSSKITSISQTAPVEFSLTQNYPNPFNPSTVISYSLPVNGMVTLKIFNTLGQEVATLVNEMQDAGFKTVTWNASNMPSGIYYYSLNAGTFTDTKKLLLMK